MSSTAKRSSVPLIAVSVVVVLLVAVIGGELFVRQQIKSCLAGQLESELGSQVEVGLGLKPVLLSLVVWAWLWGAWGMVLAVPIAAVFRIVSQHTGFMRSVGTLMSDQA